MVRVGCLAGQVVRHLLEGRDERITLLRRVRDRQRPLLLAPGRHVDTTVHVVEPREIGELAVLLRLEALVVDDLLAREGHAALRTDSDGITREAVVLEDGRTTREQ